MSDIQGYSTREKGRGKNAKSSLDKVEHMFYTVFVSNQIILFSLNMGGTHVRE